MTNKIRVAIGAVMLGMLLLFAQVGVASAGDKTTICHASGLDGTTKYETLTISDAALSAHFDEHGTPRAGHEQDYYGACVVVLPSSSPSVEPTTEPSAEPTPEVTPEPTPSITPEPTPEVTPSPTPEVTPTPTPTVTPVPTPSETPVTPTAPPTDIG